MKTSVGSHLVVTIPGDARKYIAEVVSEEPLVLKVEDSGPYSKLKSTDYIIHEDDSERIQNDDETAVLREAVKKGRPLISGLASLGITDGQIREILPDDD